MLELPLALVPTKAKVAAGLRPMVTLRDAAVPAALMEAEVTLATGGEKTGKKEKLAPVKFAPVTCMLTTLVKLLLLRFTLLGVTEVITGTWKTVKLLAK